jgi:multicomponent Na+:H+ antiporter subunit F
VTLVTSICFGILAASGTLCAARAIRPGSVADRIVSLDSLLVVLVASIAVLVARTRISAFVDVLVVAALLGFVGTVTVARYIERRGA